MRDEMRDDAPDFVILRKAVHQSRKDRLCDCGRVIPAGARYERVCGTEDGRWFTHVSCAKPQPRDDCPHPFPPDPYEPLAYAEHAQTGEG